MRFVTSAARALHPFSRSWLLLLALAFFLTFGLGGGTPGSAAWLIVKFFVLGVLLTSLLLDVGTKARNRLRQRIHANRNAEPS